MLDKLILKKLQLTKVVYAKNHAAVLRLELTRNPLLSANGFSNIGFKRVIMIAVVSAWHDLCVLPIRVDTQKFDLIFGGYRFRVSHSLMCFKSTYNNVRRYFRLYETV